MPNEFDLERMIIEAQQKNTTRARAEIIAKNVELGQIRKLSVPRDSRLRDLNGAEVRITNIDEENGNIKFELTANNTLSILDLSMKIRLEANIESLFIQLDNGLEQKFKELVGEKRIEIGKRYKIKTSIQRVEEGKVIGIDYVNRYIKVEVNLFGRATLFDLEIESVTEEIL